MRLQLGPIASGALAVAGVGTVNWQRSDVATPEELFFTAAILLAFSLIGAAIGAACRRVAQRKPA